MTFEEDISLENADSKIYDKGVKDGIFVTEEIIKKKIEEIFKDYETCIALDSLESFKDEILDLFGGEK